jgi:MFS transporter, ACS family, hexuronate transporter
VLKDQPHFTTQQYSFVVAAFQISHSLTQPVAGFFTDLISFGFGYFLFALLWAMAAVLHAFAGG